MLLGVGIVVWPWARRYRPDAATIGAATAVVGVLTPFILRWLDRRRAERSATQTPQSAERLVMVRRVRHKWIAGVLEPSLAHAARLALGLERRPSTLDLGAWGRRGPGRPLQPLPADTPIQEVFDEVGGGLLILGAPGAGKTTVLLQLAEELLDRAERDPAQPIPVVVNLASWVRRRQPLVTWLVDELVVDYNVPRRIAHAWIAADALVLLLDGLDEVAEQHRVACAEAINAYRREHGLVPLAVCSRVQELEALSVKLRLEEAVELQPPSESQIASYLGYLEATGTPLEDVRAALSTDEELRTLLRTPLLLHVIALAYHGRPLAALEAPGSNDERRARLWNAYLTRMFEQRPLYRRTGGDMAQQAVGWLAWLAGRLRDRDQSEFHLDRLDLRWLPTRSQRLLARVAVWLVAWLGIVLTFGVFGALFGVLEFATVSAAASGLGSGPAGALALAMSDAAGFGVQAAVVALPVILLIAGRELAAPAEELHWSPRELIFGLTCGVASTLPGWMLAALTGRLDLARPDILVDSEAGLAMALAVVFGLVFGLAAWLLGRRVRGSAAANSSRRFFHQRGVAPYLGLVFGLFAIGSPLHGLVGGLVFGLTYGLAAGLEAALRNERTRPNEGIRQSARHALWLGLATGVAAGLAVGLTYGLLGVSSFESGLIGGLFSGLLAGLAVGLVVGLVVGGDACLQHYAVRAQLTRTGAAPWRYGSFLDAMTERLLLRRAGSAYLFVHRLLRDHLGEMDRGQAVQQELASQN